MQKYSIEDVYAKRLAVWCTTSVQANKIWKAAGGKDDWNPRSSGGFEVFINSMSNSAYPCCWQGGYDKTYFTDCKTASACIDFNQIYFKEDGKITGYKTPFDLYGGKVSQGTVYKVGNVNSNFEYFLTDKSGVLNYGRMPKEIVETWEPEYQDIFNVGDWVTVIETPNDYHWILKTKERTFKLNGVNHFFGCSYKSNTSSSAYGLSGCKFRKATLEEIEMATKSTLTLSNGQSVNITKETIIAAGEEIDSVKLEKLINPTFDSFNDWTVKVEDVTYSIGCWKGVTKADIILILKTQKELPS